MLSIDNKKVGASAPTLEVLSINKFLLKIFFFYSINAYLTFSIYLITLLYAITSMHFLNPTLLYNPIAASLFADVSTYA